MDAQIIKKRLDLILLNYKQNKHFSISDYKSLANIHIALNNIKEAKRLYKKISTQTNNLEDQQMFQHLTNITNVKDNFNTITLTLV